MKILLTGANGYIGLRLLPQLIDLGHEVICAVRNKERFKVIKEFRDKIQVVEIDFLKDPVTPNLIKNIDVAYYLIHSMTASTKDFDDKESLSASNLNNIVSKTSIRQVIFLSGIVNEEKLSRHLKSRKQVEDILYSGNFNLTVLRAAIIVGSGSSSFEIIRDLCEKLPVMITPKW